MSTGFLINPEDKTIDPIEVRDLAEIASLIGYDTIASDGIGDGNDRLFFDEECFIRGSSGRFQLDRLVPVAGKGVVVGLSIDGSTLADVALSQAELAERLRFD